MDDPRQFKSFDGLDNRKEVMNLFDRLGRGLPDDQAGARRAGVLQGLLQVSTSQFSGHPTVIDPCTSVEAYNLFVAITGVLRVDIDWAANVLRKAVQWFERGDHEAPVPERRVFEDMGAL